MNDSRRRDSRTLSLDTAKRLVDVATLDNPVIIIAWKGCNVTVYETDNEGKERTRMLVGMPNGQGILPIGTKLYVTDGKVKET